MSGLAIAGLTVRRGRRRVLTDVSIRVPAAGWLGVIGPNGAGKTTLLRAIAGLIGAEGSITIGGDDTAALTRRELARRIAYLPQQPTIPEAIPVDAYVLLGRTPYMGYLGAPSDADRRIADGALDDLALLELRNRPVHELSGGEFQRVLLARAIAQRPDLLLLDEPTSALDIGHQLDALELADELRRTRGVTIVSCMHDLTLAGRFADDLLLLSAGRTVAHGPPEQVLTQDVVGRYLNAHVRIDRDGDGVVVVPVRRAPAMEPLA